MTDVPSPEDNAYISKVKSVLEQGDDLIKAIDEIAGIDLPDNGSELVNLISAAASELEWDRQDTYDYLGGEELDNALRDTAERSLEQIQKYLKDFEKGNYYHAEYTLYAKYRGLHGRAYDRELSEFPIRAKDMDDARRQAEEWRKELPESIRVGEYQDEFKIDSVGVETKIVDTKGDIIDDDIYELHDY
jgi:hypothetical protein